MLSRQEMKRRGRHSLKHHYLLLVAVCLLAAFLGTEFGSSLSSIKSVVEAVSYTHLIGEGTVLTYQITFTKTDGEDADAVVADTLTKGQSYNCLLYTSITRKIRRALLALAHVSREAYTAVLMQGSGTFGVESVITSVVGEKEKLLIAANGSYGERMADIAEHAGIAYVLYREP